MRRDSQWQRIVEYQYSPVKRKRIQVQLYRAYGKYDFTTDLSDVRSHRHTWESGESIPVFIVLPSPATGGAKMRMPSTTPTPKTRY